MSRPLRVVPERQKSGCVYVRVSALMGRSGESFHSPDLQADAVKAMFVGRGIPFTDVIEDLDVSGRTFTRDGLEQVLALARAGAIGYVGLYDLSRLGRDTAESLRHIRELRELGVAVLSTVERIDDSPEGQFMLTQFLAMAQLYSDQIGRRWLEATNRVVQQGLWAKAAPIGYIKQGLTLTVHPVVGPAITEMFEDFAAGIGTKELAERLSGARSVPTKRTVIRQLLDNPTYIGQIRWQGMVLPGQHPPLVDGETWKQVRARRIRDARTPSRTQQAVHPLAGILVCDGCGYAAWVRGDPRVGTRRYMCGTRGEAAEPCQGCGSALVGEVVDAVLAEIIVKAERLGVKTPDTARRNAKKARAGADVERLCAELARTEGALGNLTADRALRVISEVAYAKAAGRLEASAANLRERLDVARQLAAVPAGENAAASLRQVVDMWPLATDRERNRLIRTVVQQVRIRRSAFYREPPAARVTVVML